mmetsp:Transcript_116401/g.325583  ORF Transcript_116401/g.325583 Transcript_116401/m.325583 type:complete len:237 (-) Transcript_116401:42-752(-)
MGSKLFHDELPLDHLTLLVQVQRFLQSGLVSTRSLESSGQSTEGIKSRSLATGVTVSLGFFFPLLVLSSKSGFLGGSCCFPLLFFLGSFGSCLFAFLAVLLRHCFFVGLNLIAIPEHVLLGELLDTLTFGLLETLPSRCDLLSHGLEVKLVVSLFFPGFMPSEKNLFASLLEEDIVGRKRTLRIILGLVAPLLSKRGLAFGGHCFLFVVVAAAVVCFGHDISRFLELGEMGGFGVS